MPINYLAVKQLLVSSLFLSLLYCHYPFSCYFILTNPTSLSRTSRLNPVPTVLAQPKSTRNFAITWSILFMRVGRRRALRGNNITPRRVKGSARSILRAGRVWWSRLWLCRISVKAKRRLISQGMSCRQRPVKTAITVIFKREDQKQTVSGAPAPHLGFMS